MSTIMKHTVGFIASIVLTLLAVYVTLYTSLTFQREVDNYLWLCIRPSRTSIINVHAFN